MHFGENSQRVGKFVHLIIVVSHAILEGLRDLEQQLIDCFGKQLNEINSVAQIASTCLSVELTMPRFTICYENEHGQLDLLHCKNDLQDSVRDPVCSRGE